MIIPHFVGWFPLADDQPSQEGDMLVALGTYEKKSYPEHAKPDTGYNIMNSSTWRGKSRNDSLKSGGSSGWRVYRRGPRILPGNAHFSKELPLP